MPGAPPQSVTPHAAGPHDAQSTRVALRCAGDDAAARALNATDTLFVVIGLVGVTALAARRLQTPNPVLYALAGLVAGLAWPHLSGSLPVVVPPDLVLFVFLPPLLVTAAYSLPLASVRRNAKPIALLAVGLVLATMATTAFVAHALTGLPWAAALALGAIIAPPDPVAATTIATRMGLPPRMVVLLEGEGLINDAVAIVAFQLAIAAAVSGTWSWGGGALMLLREVPLGIAVGLAIAWGARWLRCRVDSVPLEVGISVVTPYLAYHLADRFGGSGVLAVVTLGFLLRRYVAHIQSPASRLAARTVWGAFRYASTALVFLLLGLLIGEIALAWPGWRMVGAGAVLALAVIALRLLWLWAVPGLTPRAKGEARPLRFPERTVLGWAGMRGVVSLALALALPASLPATQRGTIIHLTLAVILATLIGQGATLLPLLRWLRVGDMQRAQREEARARRRARRAGVRALEHQDRPAPPHRGRLLARVDDGSFGIARTGRSAGEPGDQHALLAALEAQRRVLERLRDAGHLSESVVERLENELDLDELGAGGEAKRLTGD